MPFQRKIREVLREKDFEQMSNEEMLRAKAAVAGVLKEMDAKGVPASKVVDAMKN